MEDFKNFEADTEFGKLYSDVKRIHDLLDQLYKKEPDALEMSFKEHVPFIPLFVKHREEIINAINKTGLTIAENNILLKDYSSISDYTNCVIGEYEVQLETFLTILKENSKNSYDYENYYLHMEDFDYIEDYADKTYMATETYIVETIDIYDILYSVNNTGDIILETVNITAGAFSKYSQDIRFNTGLDTISDW